MYKTMESPSELSAERKMGPIFYDGREMGPVTLVIFSGMLK